MNLPLIKMYKYATVLIKYFANTHTIFRTLAKLFISAIQVVIQEAIQFAKQTRKKPCFIDIMSKLELFESIAQKYMLQNEKIEDQFVILKNALITGESTQKSLS